jgi:hypothetical protein
MTTTIEIVGNNDISDIMQSGGDGADTVDMPPPMPRAEPLPTPTTEPLLMPNPDEDDERKKIIDEIMNAPTHPPPFSIENLSVDERGERRQLMKKIRLYMANFKDLRAIDMDDIEEHATTERLKLVVEDIEFQLSSKRSFEMPMTAYKVGCMGIENITCKAGMKTEGFATICTNDESILETAKELFIKYDCSKDIPCEYRLAMSLSMVLFSLHSLNKKREKIENAQQNTENIENAFEKAQQNIENKENAFENIENKENRGDGEEFPSDEKTPLTFDDL